MKWRILKVQLPLLAGVAGHNFIVIVDEQQQVVHELHGLATSKQGTIKAIGYLPSDELRFYTEQRPDRRVFFYRPHYRQRQLFVGTKTEVLAKMAQAVAMGQAINALKLPYPILGLGRNSNAVASTLLRAMGLPDPKLGRAIALTEGKLLIALK